MQPEPPSRRSTGLRRAGLAALGAAGLSACAADAPQDTWAPAGEEAQRIHDLQWPIFMIAGIVGVIVLVFITLTVVKYRDRGQPIPEQTHGKAWLEYLFIALPAVLLASIAVPTVATVIALNDTDDADCVINVTGQQWWWEYDYPVAADGSICGFTPTGEPAPIVTSGQMVIPVDAKVVIRGTSRDVIHSFWVPKLNGKRDMVPGRVHTWNFHAERPGIFAGQCAEFCGLSHANMRMEIVALGDADFQTWLDNQLEPYQAPEPGTLAATGEQTFISQCSRCHQIDGLTDADGDLVVSAPEQWVWSGAAPNLTNFMTRNTFAGATWDLLTEQCRVDVWEASPADFGERYLAGVDDSCLNEIDLKEWLRNAPAKKPMYADPELLEETDNKVRGMPNLALSEDQIDELVAYLLERK
ncbi:MAG: cytochrome c oxidase subunit II [Ilumatobacter sp.]|uniref:cytochrome c oxidase subunit II n=1 Tax=Ilumatobacter sp. TaxID=1967498 RepID=UPI0026332BE7|nr:cytochrome c oxidase subunit II [Ilumatobacter sp.]MDJ0770300.1 cytochrome c oxidase subunit II [Ilumatobacter sp.]